MRVSVRSEGLSFAVLCNKSDACDCFHISAWYTHNGSRLENGATVPQEQAASIALGDLPVCHLIELEYASKFQVPQARCKKPAG
jgi:hypothetical protein